VTRRQNPLYPVYTIEQTSSKHQAGFMAPWLKCRPRLSPSWSRVI